MALSPADFYAYSRATGVPVPEDPYEKAELAPQVLEFRRNQLKAPEQEPNIAQALGMAAIGTAAAIGAGLAGRRFFGRGAQAAKPAVRPTSRGITVGDLKEYTSGPVQKVAATSRPTAKPLADPWGQETVPPSIRPAATVDPSIPAPGTTTNALEIDPTDRLIAEFQQMRSAQTQDLSERMERGYVRQLYKTADQLMDELQGESLTSLQQATAPVQGAQVNNAVETGANQTVGRAERIERRDPQYDPTQNALLNEMADADETWMRQQDQPREALALEVEEPRPLTSQEFADIAKDEMIARRQAVEARGLRPGTSRFERALAEGWASKPNLLPGSEKFNQNISLPSSIRKAVEAASIQEVPAKEYISGLTGLPPERTLINVGPDAQIERTAAGTAIRGTSATLNEALPKRSLRELLSGDMGPDIPGSQRVRGAMEADVPPTQLSKQEITYSFLNQAPEPEIPGGSAGIGVYGVEPGYVPGAMSKTTGEYSAASSRKPTYVPGWLAKREATPFAAVSNQGLENALSKANKSGVAAITNEINRRQVNREGVVISEAFRRARIEGRDPQTFLNNAMAQQGISAVGDFLPIKKTTPSAPVGSSSLNPVSSRKATPAEQAFARYTRIVGNPYQM